MDVRVDHANPYTNQIFQEAVIRNDLAVAKLLLKYGIYPRRNERNRQGLTGLQQSVLDGNVKMSILLLEAGADIEAKTSNGWTCLHIASALGDLEILITMINHCADLVALTKNEELPIDLAATRDIKIKLAKEMSRVGYSELAQWYMRKLAAREGVFYVLSTNTLLDLACDDNYDKSYSNTYPYYMTNCTEYSSPYVQHSPARGTISNSTVWKRTEEETVPSAKQNTVWLEVTEPKNTTYLTYASGYLSEAVFDHSSGEYKRVRNSASTSSAGSPSRKNNISVTDGVPNIPSFGSTSEVMEFDNFSRNSGTLRSGSYKKTNSMQRKPSKIELHIDYTNSTEDDAEEDELDTEIVPTDNNVFLQKSPVFEQNKSSTGTSQYQTGELDKPKQTAITTSEKTNEVEANDSGDIRNRNVRFNTIDSANEFCNCPNCKKMGYAFSPDIITTSRKMIHVDKSYILSPDKGLSYGAFPIQSQYYPPTTTGKHGLYYGNENDYKPRKRKKKLFSGIKSMFKDSIRVHRTTEQTPMTEDAGILFAVSLRDRDKSKTIRERHVIRKSNSFSEGRHGYGSEEVSVYPHNHVVPPPSRFADSDYKDESEQDDNVFEMERWFDYGHPKKNDRLNSQQFLRDFGYEDQPTSEIHSEKCNDEFCCTYNKKKEFVSNEVRLNTGMPRKLIDTTCVQGRSTMYYLEGNT